MFGDRPRDIGRRTTGHETIRGESFLGFGDARAGWMSLSHKSRAVSSGAAVRSSRRSSCRALITLGRPTRASALSPILHHPGLPSPLPLPFTPRRRRRRAYLSSFSRNRPPLLPPVRRHRPRGTTPRFATNPDYILQVTLYRKGAMAC